MGKVLITGSGSAGAGSDECTTTRSEVLKGYTAITSDSDDEVVEGALELIGDAADSQVLAGKTYYNTNPKIKRTGIMVNHGAVSQTLSAGGSYTVPAGYHNGSGKVTANSLASQTSGTSAAAQILSGYTAWVNGSKLTGSMPNISSDDTAKSIGQNNNYLYVRMSYGAHITNTGTGYPEVKASFSSIASLLGISASNIRSGASILGVSGNMVDYSYLATGQVSF